MSSFRPHEWVLVGDIDICPYSKEQIGVLQNMDHKIKGVIFCNEHQHENSAPCQMVPAFPALCNIESSFCFTGLRSDQHSLDDVQAESDNKKAQ